MYTFIICTDNFVELAQKKIDDSSNHPTKCNSQVKRAYTVHKTPANTGIGGSLYTAFPLNIERLFLCLEL